MRPTDTLILNEQSQTVKTLFDQFTKELRYLRNLSERTIFSYRDAFERWLKYVGAMPTERNLSQFILGMREAGLSITTCNIYVRSINSFLTWLKENGHCPQTFSVASVARRDSHTLTGLLSPLASKYSTGGHDGQNNSRRST